MASTSSSPAIHAGPGWWRRLGGALVATSGLAVLAFVALNLIQDCSLWILGRRTQAQVIAAWIERDAEPVSEAPTFRWFVRYQFRMPAGQVVTGVSRISANEWAALGNGAPLEVSYEGEAARDQRFGAVADGGWVNVVYLPAYPAHNRLDESRFVPVLACAYVPLTLLGCAGLAAGRSLIQST